MTAGAWLLAIAVCAMWFMTGLRIGRRFPIARKTQQPAQGLARAAWLLSNRCTQVGVSGDEGVEPWQARRVAADWLLYRVRDQP